MSWEKKFKKAVTNLGGKVGDGCGVHDRRVTFKGREFTAHVYGDGDISISKAGELVLVLRLGSARYAWTSCPVVRQLNALDLLLL